MACYEKTHPPTTLKPGRKLYFRARTECRDCLGDFPRSGAALFRRTAIAASINPLVNPGPTC